MPALGPHDETLRDLDEFLPSEFWTSMIAHYPDWQPPKLSDITPLAGES